MDIRLCLWTRRAIWSMTSIHCNPVFTGSPPILPGIDLSEIAPPFSFGDNGGSPLKDRHWHDTYSLHKHWKIPGPGHRPSRSWDNPVLDSCNLPNDKLCVNSLDARSRRTKYSSMDPSLDNMRRPVSTRFFTDNFANSINANGRNGN